MSKISMKSMITEEKALAIVGEFVNDLLRIDPEGILAVCLTGSLGGGYYRPGQSDIDTAVIVKDDALLTLEQAESLADEYFNKYQIPKGFGSEFIQERDLYPPYEKSIAEEYEFTVEIARLKIQGKPVYGAYDLSSIQMPARKYFRRDALIFTKWLASVDDGTGALDITSCVNTILMHMRRYLMLEKGVFEFNKFKMISAYLSNEPDIVDNDVFSFVERYLKNEETQPEAFTGRLREFTKTISDYYNRKLLGFGADS